MYLLLVFSASNRSYEVDFVISIVFIVCILGISQMPIEISISILSIFSIYSNVVLFSKFYDGKVP